MKIAKPNIVQVLSELESRYFFRAGGSPFLPPRIKGRVARPAGIAKNVSDAIRPRDTPREVDPGPMLRAGESAHEVDVGPFLDHIVSGTFNTDTVGKPTKSKGWDAAAWYCPIHFYGFEWGIYVRLTSVYEIALDILHTYSPEMAANVIQSSISRYSLDDLSGMTDEQRNAFRHASAVGAAIYGKPHREWLDYATERLIEHAIKAAYFMLFHHELFHHFVESLGTKVECMADRPVYLSYVDSVYKPSKGTSHLVEEALANAFSLRSVAHPKFDQFLQASPNGGGPIKEACLQYMRDRFPTDPPGYNRALEFGSDADFERGIAFLFAQVKQTNATPVGEPMATPILSAQLDFLLEDDEIRCVELPVRQTYRILQDTALQFENNGKKLQRELKKAGFSLMRQGTHEVWAKAGTSVIPVPRTSRISNGTAEGILKAIDPANRLRNFQWS